MKRTMSEKLTITSATEAVKRAYARAAIVCGSVGAVATGLYLNAQRIAESHVPGGIWTAEAWGQDWGSDGKYALLSLGGALLVGAITAVATPLSFREVYERSHTRTEFDSANRMITQTSSTPLGTLKSEFEYDAIVSIRVNQGPLGRRADTGDLEITAVSLDAVESEGEEGNSRLEERVFTIPYQAAPFDLRERLFENLAQSHDVLKGKL